MGCLDLHIKVSTCKVVYKISSCTWSLATPYVDWTMYINPFLPVVFSIHLRFMSKVTSTYNLSKFTFCVPESTSYDPSLTHHFW